VQIVIWSGHQACDINFHILHLLGTCQSDQAQYGFLEHMLFPRLDFRAISYVGQLLDQFVDTVIFHSRAPLKDVMRRLNCITNNEFNTALVAFDTKLLMSLSVLDLNVVILLKFKEKLQQKVFFLHFLCKNFMHEIKPLKIHGE
jgi:hypothetical protein